MRRAHVVYRFGAFELDPASRQLTAGTETVRLTDPQAAVLLQLVSRAPEVVSKDALAKAGWGAAPTSNNNIEQVVSRLRKVLEHAGGLAFVETVPNGGYRFTAPIEQLEPVEPLGPDHLDDEPFRAFVEGHRDLTTLNRDAIANARRKFTQTIEHSPTHVRAHIGLANACALAFEGSRVDPAPNHQALTSAVEHARLATTIAPASADAWSTLGFVLNLSGDTEAATVACNRAVALNPRGWWHWFRLAFVSWGEDRIEAVEAALALRPDLAFAHWLRCTVLIARGAFEAALTHVHAGCIAQDKQAIAPGPYPAVGLHLLRGQILTALERLVEAEDALAAELAGPDRGQLYSRECAANTWYTRGAIHVRQGRIRDATAAFERALEIAPGHLYSLAALGRPLPTLAPTDPRAANAAFARAIALARSGRHADAAECCRGMMASAREAHAGWLLPVEPILHVSARPEIWRDALAIVQQRAG